MVQARRMACEPTARVICFLFHLPVLLVLLLIFLFTLLIHSSPSPFLFSAATPAVEVVATGGATAVAAEGERCGTSGQAATAAAGTCLLLILFFELLFSSHSFPLYFRFSLTTAGAEVAAAGGAAAASAATATATSAVASVGGQPGGAAAGLAAARLLRRRDIVVRPSALAAGHVKVFGVAAAVPLLPRRRPCCRRRCPAAPAPRRRPGP